MGDILVYGEGGGGGGMFIQEVTYVNTSNVGVLGMALWHSFGSGERSCCMNLYICTSYAMYSLGVWGIDILTLLADVL